jgi:adenylate kinase family enzyme
VVGERLRAYERQTEPVLEFLKGAGYAFFEVDGADASPQAIARRIEKWVEGARGLGPRSLGQ